MNARIRWLPVALLLALASLSWAGDAADKMIGGWSHTSLGNTQVWIVTRDGDKWAVEGYYTKGKMEIGTFVGQDVKYADGVLTFVQKMTKKFDPKGPDEVQCMMKLDRNRMLVSWGAKIGKLWQPLERDKSITVAEKSNPKDNEKFLGRWKATSPGKFEELLTIAFMEGKWTVVGIYRKGSEEVGSFHGDNIKVAKDTLTFQRIMDKKPAADYPDSALCTFTPTDDKAELKAQANVKPKLARMTLVRVAKGEELALLEKKEREAKEKKEVVKDKDKKDPDPKPGGPFTEIAKIVGDKGINSPGAAMSPDGKLLAIIGGRPGANQLVVINFKTKEIVKRINLDVAMVVVWSTDGRTLAVLNSGTIPLKGPKSRPSQVSVWNCETWEQRALFDHPGYPRHLAISHDGSVLAIGNDVIGREEPGIVNVWNVPAKKTILSLKVNTSIALDLSADGKTLALSGWGPEQGQVGFVDTSTGKARAAATIKVVAERMVLSADGKVAVVGNSDKLIVVDAMTQTARYLPTKGQGGIGPLALVNNDKHVAVGAATDEIRFVALDSGKVDYTLRAAKNAPPMRLQANPDSTLFLTYTSDRVARLWTTPFRKQ